MYYIVWSPKVCLLQERHTHYQCGRNAMEFKTFQQATTYIAESDRFEEDERKLCFVVKRCSSEIGDHE